MMSSSHDDLSGTSPRGFARLARRLSSWAANLLATGLILVAGLALGRQVLSWWRADPAQSSSRQALSSLLGADVSDVDQPRLLEFGDFPITVRRSTLSGGIERVLSALRQSCREAARGGEALTPTVGPAEQRMLAGLKGLEPVERVLEECQIYQIDEPIPMTVAVRSPPSDGRLPGDVAAAEPRVVSWGLALPVVLQTDEDPVQWTLFTYAASGHAALPDSDAPQPPIPPAGRRTVSLRTESGSAMIGFSGEGDLPDWMQFYDDHLVARQWEVERPWVHHARIWQRRFQHARLGSIDVQLMAAGDESLRGLLVVTPTAERATEN